MGLFGGGSRSWSAAVAVGVFAAAAVASPGFAQVATPDSVDVVPGATYAGGSFRRWLLGAHYRDLWTTQIRVPVLNISDFAGGLTPTSAHTGSQTTSLRFDGADGRTYQFRRVFKTPTAGLPPALRNTLVADLLQDGASASHPLGTVIVTPLLEAAGVLHADPRLFVMPDDPALGEFRADFAGMLGTIEERPNEAEDGRGGFGEALQVIGPDRLFERIGDGPDDRVDAEAFLSARLVDILVGDRDRHRDNFRWALMDRALPRMWRPISRDHDEAFVKLDGVALTLAKNYYPQLTSFAAEYANTLNLNWHSREVDRRFLTGLSWSDWEPVVAEVQRNVTNEVIESAVRRIPTSMFEVGGQSLIDALKARRDALPDEARQYYGLLAEEVEIHATNAAELLEVTRIDDCTVEVTLQAAAPGSAPYLHRRFHSAETREVRINLWGGRDRAVVRGSGRAPIELRIIGGSGRDQLIDSTTAGGVHFYDAGDATEVEAPSSSTVDRRRYGEWIGSDLDRYPPRQWGHWVRPYPVIGAGSDAGVLLGARIDYTRYGFRKEPYAWKLNTHAAVATGDGWGEAGVSLDFNRSNSRVGLDAEARLSGIDLLRFHGFGNDTPLEGLSSSAHRVGLNQLTLRTDVTMEVRDGFTVYVGPRLNYSSTEVDESAFFISVQDTLYGAGRFGQVGLGAGVELDRLGPPALSGPGYAFAVDGHVSPGSWDVVDAFGRVSARASVVYRALRAPASPVFTARVGGDQILGNAPFQQAAYLGGRETLRGWSSDRFAGDAAVHGSVEAQFALARFQLMLPAQFGVTGFVDAGRVYFDGQSSGGLHTGYGGGVWIAFLGRQNAISLMLAGGGDDGVKVLTGTGIGF